MERSLGDLLARHPFFADLSKDHIDLLAGCGRNVTFKAGDELFREGDAADSFYVLRVGSVALEVFVPGRGAFVLDTVPEGGVVGISWLLPPYRWQFDGRALDVVRAISVDGLCLRGKCEEDARLGYELMKRFAGLLADRMQSARLRLVDVYGHAGVG